MEALDLEKLTLGEIATIENLSGSSIADIGDESKPKGKAMAALAMVAKRRSGFPAFRFDDAMAMTMEQAQAAIGWDDEPDEDSDANATPDGDGDATPAEEEATPVPTQARKGSRSKSA